MIGTFGPVKFIASADTMRTFRDFKRTTSARWAVHDIHLKQPVPEYLGPGQGAVSLAMQFDVQYGINPRVEMDKLVVMARKGQRHRLVIGGKGLGVGYWYINNLNEEWTAIDNKGLILRSSVQVELSEYV